MVLRPKKKNGLPAFLLTPTNPFFFLCRPCNFMAFQKRKKKISYLPTLTFFQKIWPWQNWRDSSFAARSPTMAPPWYTKGQSKGRKKEHGPTKTLTKELFQYHRRNACTDWLNFLSSPGQLPLGMDLQPKLSLRRQLMGLSPKYNDLGLGRDMAWYACLWGLLVSSFNCGGLICQRFVLLSFSCFFK